MDGIPSQGYPPPPQRYVAGTHLHTRGEEKQSGE